MKSRTQEIRKKQESKQSRNQDTEKARLQENKEIRKQEIRNLPTNQNIGELETITNQYIKNKDIKNTRNIEDK